MAMVGPDFGLSPMVVGLNGIDPRHNVPDGLKILKMRLRHIPNPCALVPGRVGSSYVPKSN